MLSMVTTKGQEQNRRIKNVDAEKYQNTQAFNLGGLPVSVLLRRKIF